MKTQRTFCISHEPPLTPEHLFDYAIGIGGYRPQRGAHISELEPFWNQMRPLSYGAAGNYAVLKVIETEAPAAELTGIFSHRKIVVRNCIGREAIHNIAYREISPTTASSLPAEEVNPNQGLDFLIAHPEQLGRPVVQHCAQVHYAIDLYEYLTIAVQIGVMTTADVQEFSRSTVLIQGGCELGIYPTDWLYSTLKKLELVGRQFVTQCSERIRTYDAYQVRAVGFLAERLGSYFLVKELRSRYLQGVPHSLFGHLCVIVPDGKVYGGALACS